MTAAPKPDRERLWLAAFGLLVFLAGLGGHDLWNPDEPRYAVVAREMLERGDFVLPHLNGEVYTQKPPLLFWSIAAASLPFGAVTEWSARLPSALAAWIALLLVHDLGRRLFPGDKTALLSTLAFGTCWKILWQSHVGQIDMLLTCLVTAAVWFWARSRLEKRPSLVWGFWLCTGLATLAKGPVGLLPPLLAITVHLALEKDGSALRDLRWGRGLLLWASVVLAWLLPAIARGGASYAEKLVFRQTVTRYIDPWHHHQPFHYYLTTALPADFLPWIFLLPAALWAAWRGLRGEPRLDAERRWWRFLLAWVVVTLLFFSASSAKRTVYVLTLYPALALLVGRGLALLASGTVASTLPRRGRMVWLVVPGTFLTVLWTAATAYLALVGPGRPEAAPLDPTLPYRAAMATGCVAVAVAVATWLWALRRDRILAGVVTVASGMAAFSLLLFVVVLPAVDPVKSARDLAAAMDRTMPESVGYAIHPRLDPGVLVYAEGRRATPLDSEDELRSWIDSAAGQPRWLLVERDAAAKAFGSTEPPDGIVEWARDADPHDGYLLWEKPAADEGFGQ